MPNHERKSTKSNPFRNTILLHLATRTESNVNTGKFPPPIHHRLMGYGAAVLSPRLDLYSFCNLDDETSLVAALMGSTLDEGSTVVSFACEHFVYPVLRGACYRNGVLFSAENSNWYDVGQWFGNSGKGTMTDFATAIGLGPRIPIDFSNAVLNNSCQDILDQLLLDTFLVLSVWARQQVAEGKMTVDRYRKVITVAKKKVRAKVQDPEMKRYVSWKEMNRESLLLESHVD